MSCPQVCPQLLVDIVSLYVWSISVDSVVTWGFCVVFVVFVAVYGCGSLFV